MRRYLNLLNDQRGTVIVYTLMTIIGVLVVTGIATDVGRAVAAKAELQKSFDAGVLAGAHQLGLDSSTFNTAGTAAVTWASNNPYTGGTPSPTWNVGNTGHVKLGVYNPTNMTWQASLSPVGGVPVNAVSCQWSAPIPTAFLSLVGMNTINIAARSTAFRGAPATPCPGCPVFPLGVPRCAFPDFSTAGCGSIVNFTTGTNTGAGWVNLLGGGANADDIRPQLAGTTTDIPTLTAGVPLQATDGNIGAGWNDLAEYKVSDGTSSGYFVTKFTTGPSVTVKDGAGTTTVYSGPGWEVLVPVVETSCTSPLPSPVTIVTWTYLVIVQVINGGYCTVNNGSTGPWAPNCKPGINGGTGPTSANGNAVYGYYSCKLVDSESLGTGAPLTAFATRPRLGQ